MNESLISTFRQNSSWAAWKFLSMATGKARATEDCGSADSNWTSQNFVANSPV